jgi:metal iron transporter
MPHSLFLGSALATQDRVSSSSSQIDTADTNRTPHRPKLDRAFSLASSVLETKQHVKGFFATAFNNAFRVPEKGTTPKEILKDTAKSHSKWVNNSQEFVKKHIYHGTVDIVFSLLGFAVVINSL